MVRVAWRVCLFWLLSGLVSCAPNVFICEVNDQCQGEVEQGRCEANGRCSFPDPQCDSGRRFGSSAGHLSGECLEPAEETGTETGSGAPATTTTTTDEGPWTESGASTSSTSAPVESTSSTAESGDIGDGTTCDDVYFRDQDQDTFGDPLVGSCVPEAGYLENDEDCDDSDRRVHPDGLGCPNPSSLLGWWGFAELTGTELADRSDFANSGLAVGGLALGVEGPFGTAGGFDGMGQFVAINGVAEDLAPGGTPSPSGTLEAWVFPTEECSAMDPQQCRRIVVLVGDANAIGFGPEGEVQLAISDWGFGPGWEFRLAGDSTAEPDEQCIARSEEEAGLVIWDKWVHLAGTWGGGQCQLFVDAQLVNDSTYQVIKGPWTMARIGSNQTSSRSFVGRIDEVMIFNGFRTPGQIAGDCGVVAQCGL